MKIKDSAFFLIVIIYGISLLIFCPFTAAEEELEPIIVFSSAGMSGQGVSEINSARLSALPVASPVEALNYLGIDLQSRAGRGIQSDISLRGSGFQQVLILIDGQRFNDPQTTHHNSDLPFGLQDVERIEIIPASQSAIYGSDAIAGAVNFILKKPSQRKNHLSASFGNNDYYQRVLSLASKGAVFSQSFLFEDKIFGGSRPATDYKNYIFTYANNLLLDRADIDFNVGYNEKEFGAYDFYTPARGFASREWTKTKYINLKGRIGEDLIIMPRLMWRQHDDKFMLDVARPGLYLGHHRTDNYLFGISAEAPLDWGKISFGSDFSDERVDSSTLGRKARERYGIFTDIILDSAGPMSLRGGVRFERHSDHSPYFIFSSGLKYAVNDNNSISFSIGSNIRVPSFTELYYDDPATQGNAGLGVEKALEYEIEWERRVDEDLRYSLAVFAREEKGFIDWIKSAPADSKWRASNIDDAFTFGTQIFLDYRLSPGVNTILRYNYVNKKINDQGAIYKYGKNFTRHLVSVAVSCRFPLFTQEYSMVFKKKPLRRGWPVFSVRTSRNIKKSWELFLVINNLLNEEYQEIEGIAGQKRQFEAGMRFSW